MTTPGFVVLYRWRLKPGSEDNFVRAWSERTEALLLRGSLGSRLHKGDDGIWYSYATWPSAEERRTAFEAPLNEAEALRASKARAAMSEATLEEFPEIVLSAVADFLQ